jgi:hypothetical protein
MSVGLCRRANSAAAAAAAACFYGGIKTKVRFLFADNLLQRLSLGALVTRPLGRCQLKRFLLPQRCRIH